jgi:transcriptional regulator with XRE-family HTH domain
MGRTPSPFAAATTFGERARKRRHALGLSREDVAERSGLHWTYVGSVERGERNISLKAITQLAAALEINPAKLLEGLKP